MSIHLALESLKEFIATLEQDAQDALVMFGKISPELVTAKNLTESVEIISSEVSSKIKNSSKVTG